MAIKTAIFGLGWFWGPDAQFGLIDGVIRTCVGYAGGKELDPTYRDIKDHTEVLKVDYDDGIVSYKELAEVFFNSHSIDFPVLNNQYKSLVLYKEDSEYDTIMQLISQIRDMKKIDVYTDVQRLDIFYPAENYHQKYYLQNTMDIMIEFEKKYPKFKDFVNATDSARVNGYIKGYGDVNRLEKDSYIDLSDRGIYRLKQIVSSYF